MKKDKDNRIYFTVTGTCHRYGTEFIEPGMEVQLRKEPDNEYDSEAISAEMEGMGQIGYVANSTNTVVIGSMSAGRLYDKINDEYFAKIKFVTGSVALARVLTSDEYIAEVENPESDIHYLSDNLGKIDVDFIKKNIRGETDDSQL